MTDVTYPPLDVLKAVVEDVWIVDSGPLYVVVAPIPIRMTALRLADGSMMLHSPTRYSQSLRTAIESIGPIRHIVAPNTVHWAFMGEWQQQIDGAVFWAAPGLAERRAVKASGLRIDRELADGEIVAGGGVECIVVRGMSLAEAALFHRLSRTLVLTDLVVNVEASKLPWPFSLGAHLIGSAAPHGKTPIYARAAFKLGGGKARAAAQRLIGLDAERVLFAHGPWFETDASERLRRSLSWLAG